MGGMGRSLFPVPSLKAVLGCIPDTIGISCHRHRRIGRFFCDDARFCPLNPVLVRRHRKNALFLRDGARKTAELAANHPNALVNHWKTTVSRKKIQHNPCNSQNHWINLLPLTEIETS